jgi:hypothetical protein
MKEPTARVPIIVFGTDPGSIICILRWKKGKEPARSASVLIITRVFQGIGSALAAPVYLH